MRKKIVFLLAFLCMLLLVGCSNGKETSKYNIEYLNKDKTGIVAVPYDASATTKDALIEEFFAALSSDPDNVEYRKPIPNDVEITKYSLDGALLTIYFDADYLNMKEVEEVLCRAAVVRTMTQISGIDCVSFYVDEKPLTDVNGKMVGTMYAESFVENPGEQINTIQNTNLTLYFSNQAGDGLVKETRRVHYSSNISLEKLIMEQLLEGPESKNGRSAIPSGTKLMSVSLVDGVCYVSFDENFKNQDYSVNEAIVIYSIVDSLVEGAGVRQVQITINGESNAKYMEKVDLSQPLNEEQDWIAADNKE